jgi:pantetheine-phosphate adenylyltransferase
MVALIPGSFDPITLGHVDIIERAAGKFEKVVVAVMNNDSAKHDKTLSSKTYLFDMAMRMEFVKLSTEHIENVEVISSSGMLIDLFDEVGADVIVKGVRNGEDLEYEMKHAKWNKAHNPRVETLFLPASEGLSTVSSTKVRELIEKRELDGLEDILSQKVLDVLK